MSTLLIKNAALAATFDDSMRRIENCDIFVRDNRIAAIGQKLDIKEADKTIDASGMLVMPGMVNCHHHLYQTLTRNIPRVQEAELFPWLVNLYEIWAALTPEALYWSTLTGLGELLLTGCTTSTDHFYLFPDHCPDNLFDQQIKAAKKIGIRFQPTRGSMSRGKDQGGLPPTRVVQKEDKILEDCERVIKAYHDPDPLAMIKIALAPCSPFSVTADLLKNTAEMARKYKVRCHTHLAETQDEDAYCLNVYGKRPYDLMESVGWTGDDIWFAHCVYLNEDEIKRAAETGTGISHCPASNMRLGSGIAPIPSMVDHNCAVGLGVDGSASNDASDMLGEVRQCMLLHRLRSGVDSMPAERALTLATRGGARVLGYKELGKLEVGAGADIIGISLKKLGYAGALSDPVAAVVFCGDSHIVDFSVVNGQQVVKDGKLCLMDEMEIFEEANRWSNYMLEAAKKATGVDMCSKEGPGFEAPRPSKEKKA
ncbi:8-oxoguanine deaminase [bacterium]|nr:8-oxoguanine deaminase [bacterium]